MAIKLNEIENRKYIGRELINFEYVIKDLQGPHGETQELRIWFEKISSELAERVYGLNPDKPAYDMYTIVDDKIYRKIFGMPKNGMPLEMVVASGLVLLGTMFKEEAANREMLSFTIADIVKDM